MIRRSAAGLGADQRTLYVGISNSTTARALALGMQQVGAVSVAQLDVNHSFPRFLLYTAGPTGLTAQGAVKGLLYEKDEYLGRASTARLLLRHPPLALRHRVVCSAALDGFGKRRVPHDHAVSAAAFRAIQGLIGARE